MDNATVEQAKVLIFDEVSHLIFKMPELGISLHGLLLLPLDELIAHRQFLRARLEEKEGGCE